MSMKNLSELWQTYVTFVRNVNFHKQKLVIYLPDIFSMKSGTYRIIGNFHSILFSNFILVIFYKNIN
jgi:hypothetical protein